MRPISLSALPLLACLLAPASALGAPDLEKLALKLALAIEKADAKQVESLLRQGASPDRGAELMRVVGAVAKDRPSIQITLTPLSNALRRADAQKMVDLLLAKGANPNAPDRISLGPVSWTTCPLNIAVHRGEAPFVRLLLSKGADPNGVPGASSTPLYTAAWEGGMMYFGRTGAMRALDADIVADLLAAGADVNRAIEGAPAVFSDRAEDNQALLEVAGLQGNAGAVFPKGATPLHAAAMHGRSRWVSVFLSKGTNPNAKNEYGATPLHDAVSRGKNFAVVKALIDAGADVNAQTAYGSTPLHEAAAQTWPAIKDVVQLLLSHGASKTAKNAQGKTPLDIAAEAKNEELLGIL